MKALYWNIGWGCIQVPLMTINYSAGKNWSAALNVVIMACFFGFAYHDWKQEVEKKKRG